MAGMEPLVSWKSKGGCWKTPPMPRGPPENCRPYMAAALLYRGLFRDNDG